MEQRAKDPRDTTDMAPVALTGDTYPVRAQLKALGARWDSAERAWKIAPDRAAQAQALVDHRPPEPVTPPVPTGAAPSYTDDHVLGDELPPDLPDPFEEAENEPPLVALSGNTYAVKEALKALGARWDGERRAWLIREDKAAHARAIIDNQGAIGGGQAPFSGGRPRHPEGTSA